MIWKEVELMRKALLRMFKQQKYNNACYFDNAVL
jgi:hypothetical protein